METLSIEIHENDTTNTGTYKIWFSVNGVQKCKTLSESDTDNLLSMRQKEEFFMGKWKFKIPASELKYKLKD